MGMIGQGQRRPGTVGILPDHRNVFTFANQFKTQPLQGRQYLGLGRIYGEFRHGLHHGFGHKSIQGWIF